MDLILLAIVLFAALLLIPLGLPGTWVMIAAAMGYGYLAGEGIGFPTLLLAFGLAIVGEVIEFTLAARYTRKYGGSRRAGWGAIVGGIIGAIVGVPVPIVGSVIGAFAGAFLGALVAERTRGGTTGDATRVATGALIGRATAVAAKSAIGVAIAALILVSAWRASMRDGRRTIDVGVVQSPDDSRRLMP
jgi:uncharacterized protein YqgC (DUF456 family)